MLRIFVYTLNSPSLWPQVLLRIQAIINNILSSLTRKTLNKVAYDFSLRGSLDLLAILPTPNTLTACTDAAKAMFFALLNQKMTYNRNY